MNVDKAVFVFAGAVVLAGLALGTWVNPYWYLLTAFAGLNMFQAGFTGFCPAAIIFRRLGLKPGRAFCAVQEADGR
ncbi:MAG: DUF2892 domain-containing protein [Alphaproteobacteria bacterium]|nr:DUF2892 domain-containing protein [Alphaproteobacteria bacterium]